MAWNPTRRDVLKAGFTAGIMGATGVPLRGAAAEIQRGWRWDTGVCGLCGVGCGIQVASFADRVVAVRGDPASPVNRGLLCAKGYALPLIPYGADRLTRPLLRRRRGRFDRHGDFEPVTWEEAFAAMEQAWRRAHVERGPTGVGIVASGQSTITDGYAALKLARAGWRTNNLDSTGRESLAPAEAACVETFGIDGTSGNYDDIELTDTIALWGVNLPETYPMLWSRVVEQRLRSPSYRIVNLTTYPNRSSELADLEIVLRPESDRALWNFLARAVVAGGAVDERFVREHCVFAAGPADANASTPTHWTITFDQFQRALAPYTLELVAALTRGDPAERLEAHRDKLRALAELYAERKRKIVSFWSRGSNQQPRGAWVNEQAYMVHLLTGRQATPGCGAFSLAGQPSGCGTTREVGMFPARLPADMRVDDPEHRATTEHRWRVPPRTVNPKPGGDVTRQLRDLEEGRLRWLWIQAANPFQSTANARRWIEAARNRDGFVVVSDVYPSVSCKVADLILPSATMFEKWGGYGNAERRTQLWREQIAPPGEARSDLWQILEFSKRFALSDVWGRLAVPGLAADGFERGVLPDVLAEAERMGYRRDQSLYEVLFATPHNRTFAWPDPIALGRPNHTAVHGGIDWFPEKALFEEYAGFGRGRGHDLALFDVYFRDDVRGLRWPVLDGNETTWRFNERHDGYARSRSGFDFYGRAAKAIPGGDLERVTDPTPVSVQGKAKIFFRPHGAHPNGPDRTHDLWLSTGRVLEHWSSGTLTRRVPALHAAVPGAQLFMNREDAIERGLDQDDLVWLESPRGRIQVRVALGGRNRVPPGTVFAPWFDEGVLVNAVAISHGCAVRVVKVEATPETEP